MLQDFRFALRTLRKRPATTGLAVAMLALGIGASTVVFSLVEALLLRPLDFKDAGRLVRLYTTQEVAGGDRMNVAPGAYYDWRRRATSFEALLAAQNTGLSITDSPEPLNPLMRAVSEGYFEALGVAPRIGRTFTAEETRDGARLVILHPAFWQSYFGGDPEILGKTIKLAGEAYEIVGVMDAAYRNPAFPQPPVLWLPLTEPAQPNRRAGIFRVFGRLKPGATQEDAAAEMERISADLAALHPETDAGRGTRVVGYRDSLTELIQPTVAALAAAVGLVLLLASANVANLLLARAVGRRQEIGLRLALGARRAQLARQLLTESLVLGLASAVLGLLLAFWAMEPLLQLAPSNINVPLLDGVRLNRTVTFFTLALTIVTSVAFGLVPLLQTIKTSATLVMSRQRGGEDRGRHRLRSSLVVAEVAVSLVLLIGAGLMVRTLLSLRSIDLGFDPEGLLVTRTTARGPVWEEDWAGYHERVREELSRVAGVETEVGACEILPMFASFRPSVPVAAAGESLDAGDQPPRAVLLRASENFFSAFGTPILSGRGFTRDDKAGAENVAVISHGLARRVWGDEDAVGSELAVGETGERRLRIVGVAADLRGLAQAPEPPPILYVSHLQDPIRGMSFFLRTSGDPFSLEKGAEQAIHGISRDVPVFGTMSMPQLVRDLEWQPRFLMQLLAGFAVLALVLAASGIFAVLTYAVSERTREIGIRLAVGATRADVLRQVLAQAGRLAAVGLAIGLGGSAGLSRLLEGQLYGVEAFDPATYVVLGMALAGVALLAALLPALRATRVDPVVALRIE